MKRLLSIALIALMIISLDTVNVLGEDYVAKIGDTKYTSLQEAVNSADGKTVVVLKDVDLGSSGLNIKGASSTSKVSLTLDLNGKTLSSSHTNGYLDISYANVTIMDSVGGGKVINTDTSNKSFPINTYNAALNILSGEFSGVYCINSGKPTKDVITISGGYFDGGWDWGPITYTGGLFTTPFGNGGTDIDPELIGTGYEAKTINCEIDGVTYIAIIGKDVVVTDGLVTGGTFNFDPSDCLKEGYEAIENEGTWTVEKFVAKIGSTKYKTVKDAIKAAEAYQDGCMIELYPGLIQTGGIDPATSKLTNVTLKGSDDGTTTFKDCAFNFSGSGADWTNVTIDNIIWDNSQIVFSTNSKLKNFSVVNCTFKNLNYSSETSAVHFNTPVENFTYSNNLFEGGTGATIAPINTGVTSGKGLTGNITITNNTIKNGTYRMRIYYAASDGIADSITIKNNYYQGNASGLWVYGKGNTDECSSFVINDNVFLDNKTVFAGPVGNDTTVNFNSNYWLDGSGPIYDKDYSVYDCSPITICDNYANKYTINENGRGVTVDYEDLYSTIRFFDNNGTQIGEDIPVKVGSVLDSSKIPTLSLSGKDFVGWYYTKDNKQINFDTSSVIKTCYDLHPSFIDSNPTGNIEDVTNPLENDLNANLIVENLKDLPLTKEETTQIESGSDLLVYLKVEDISISQDQKIIEEKEAIENSLQDGQTVQTYFDASLFKKINMPGSSEEQIHKTNNKIKVSIVLSEGIRNVKYEYSVIRIHEGNIETVFTGKPDSSWKLVFETDKFSTYAVVTRETRTPAPEPKHKYIVPNTGVR